MQDLAGQWQTLRRHHEGKSPPLTAVGIDGGLALAIHDEFLAEVPEAADAGRALKIMEAAMTAAFA